MKKIATIGFGLISLLLLSPFFSQNKAFAETDLRCYQANFTTPTEGIDLEAPNVEALFLFDEGNNIWVNGDATYNLQIINYNNRNFVGTMCIAQADNSEIHAFFYADSTLIYDNTFVSPAIANDYTFRMFGDFPYQEYSYVPINTKPTVGVISINPTQPTINSAAVVSATFTSSNAPDTAIWDWGDGSATQSGIVTESNGSGSVTDTHTYASPGSYTVKLVVTDSGGLSGISQTVIAVAPSGGFTGSNLKGDNYSGANLNNQNLSGSNLMGGTFAGTNFENANLSGVNGKNVDFQNADFAGANLSNANFMVANFTNANLTGANLTGSNFKSATMTGVIYSNTICPNGTNSNNDGGTCVGQGGGL